MSSQSVKQASKRRKTQHNNTPQETIVIDLSSPSPPAGRPQRARKVPQRFEFDVAHGYSKEFVSELADKYSKDVDPNWDRDLDSEDNFSIGSDEDGDSAARIQEVSEDDSWDPMKKSSDMEEEDEYMSSSSLVSDEDEYEGDGDSDISGDVIDFGAISDQEEDFAEEEEEEEEVDDGFAVDEIQAEEQTLDDFDYTDADD